MKKRDIKNVSIEGRVCNNLMFQLVDAIETLSIKAGVEFGMEGFGLGTYHGSKINQMKYLAKDAVKVVRELSDEGQLYFGEDADKILKLVLLFIDRTHGSEDKETAVLDFLENMESNIGLNINSIVR